MSDVKFNPAVAKLREVIKQYFGDPDHTPDLNSIADIEKLADSLNLLRDQGLHDDELFLSLVFYTDPSLWSDRSALYRALWCEQVNSPALDKWFAEIVSELEITEIVEKVLLTFPVSICKKVVEKMMDIEFVDCMTVEFIQNTQPTPHTIKIMYVLQENFTRFEIVMVLDVMNWLDIHSQSSSPAHNQLLDEFVFSQIERPTAVYQPQYQDSVVMGNDYPDVTSSSILIALLDEAVRRAKGREVITYRKREMSHALADCLSLIEDTDRRVGKENKRTIAILSKCYHTVSGRLKGHKLIHDHLSQMVPLWVYEGEELVTLQRRVTLIEQWCSRVEGRLMSSKQFMMENIRIASSTHDRVRITHIAENIESYTSRSKSVRNMLLTNTIAWREEDVRILLLRFKVYNTNKLSKETEEDVSKGTREDVSMETGEDVSMETGEDVSKETEEDVSKETEEDVSKKTEEDVDNGAMQKIVITALANQSPSCCILRLDSLRSYSAYFSHHSKSLINLNLNKIRPGHINTQISNTLAVLLSINPTRTMKLFTHQLIKSKSALSNAMCKVYLRMLTTVSVSPQTYDSWLSDLHLTPYQQDEIISKCLLFSKQYESELTTHYMEQALDRLTLSNPNLIDMMRNIESALRSSHADEMFDSNLMFSIGLFTLSLVDHTIVTSSKELMQTSTNDSDMQQKRSGEVDSTLRLCIRILTTPRVTQVFSGDREKVLSIVLMSLLPSSRDYLISKNVLEIITHS